MHNLISTE